MLQYGVFLKGDEKPIAVFGNELEATRYAWGYIQNGSTLAFVVMPYFGPPLNNDQKAYLSHCETNPTPASFRDYTAAFF